MIKKSRRRKDMKAMLEERNLPFGEVRFWKRVLADSQLAMFVVDGSTRISFWSQGMAELTGFTSKEMVGMICGGETTPECPVTVADLFSVGELKDREALVSNRDGEPIPVRKSGVLIHGDQGSVLCGVEVLQDMREENRSREQASRFKTQAETNKILLASVIDTISEGAVRIDKEFNILSFSKTASELTGIPVDEAVGRKCFEVIENFLCSEHCTVKELIKRGRPTHTARTRIKLPNGETLGAVECAVSLTVEGEHEGSLLLLKDLTLQEMLDKERFKQGHFGQMVGRSKGMRDVFYLIDKLSDIDAPVLIRGERGTGRGIVAQTIHRKSVRKGGPFRVVDCGLIPARYLESEIFGHLPGAVEGAARDRIGQIELADRGTLYLVRVERLPFHVQEKVVRALETGSIKRVGGSHRIPVDVRLIAATDRDIAELAAQEKVHPGLYDRMKDITLEIPPLRERVADIELLVAHFMKALSAEDENGGPKKVSATALRALIRHSWPGNVRELLSALEYSVSVCTGATINLNDLPPDIVSALVPKEESGEEDERTRILKVLEQCHWKRSDAAKRLEMDRTTLWRKMKAYGLG